MVAQGERFMGVKYGRRFRSMLCCIDLMEIFDDRANMFVDACNYSEMVKRI